jgi:antitoxin HigA-1
MLPRDREVPKQAHATSGQRAVTGDSALRPAHFFATSPEFWLNLQKLYELRLAEAKAGAAIRRLPRLRESEKPGPRRSQSRAA